MLFAPTGALMSPVTVQQGESIPSICHAVAVELPGVSHAEAIERAQEEQ